MNLKWSIVYDLVYGNLDRIKEGQKSNKEIVSTHKYKFNENRNKYSFIIFRLFEDLLNGYYTLYILF